MSRSEPYAWCSHVSGEPWAGIPKIILCMWNVFYFYDQFQYYFPLIYNVTHALNVKCDKNSSKIRRQNWNVFQANFLFRSPKARIKGKIKTESFVLCAANKLSKHLIASLNQLVFRRLGLISFYLHCNSIAAQCSFKRFTVYFWVKSIEIETIEVKKSPVAKVMNDEKWHNKIGLYNGNVIEKLRWISKK